MFKNVLHDASIKQEISTKKRALRSKEIQLLSEVRLETGVALNGHAEAHSQDDASHQDVCLHLGNMAEPHR